jgi:murein DD-endopeptidase MepM/ murein hydrolase activator NlpD
MPLTKLRILTDQLTGTERRLSLRALIALSSLPLFGVVTAFGLAPDTDTLNVPRQTITETINLSQLATVVDDSKVERDEQIQPGDTLSSVLTRLKIDNLDSQRLLTTDAIRQIASQLKVGQRIRATTTASGQLIDHDFAGAIGGGLRITRRGDDFVSQTAEGVLESRIVMRSGRINSSLFAATDSAGVPVSVADKIADVFSTQINFRDDLRRGDTFSVIYAVNYRNGEPVATGKVLAAEFVNAGKTHRVVLYQDPFGHEDYYTPEGASLKQGFLRSPLEFTRVTSGFSNARLHPLYGFYRKHTGVDFGAPTGTRVKATADARVFFEGRKGGYGNLVILQHNNGYQTYYAHLNAFASGLRTGQVVAQGQMIGYVGATGAATGPHLHYEVRVAGIPYNPLTIKLPGAAPLAATQKQAFLQQTASSLKRLQLLQGTNTAALD